MVVVICLEGCHGSGKTALVQEYADMGFPVLNEGFMTMKNNIMHPQSLLMETTWVCSWFQRLVDHVTTVGKSSPIVIADRSPFSAIFYSRTRGDLLEPVIRTYMEEVMQAAGVHVVTVHLQTTRPLLWTRIQERLQREPHRMALNEDSQDWMDRTVQFYNGMKWTLTVANEDSPMRELAKVVLSGLAQTYVDAGNSSGSNGSNTNTNTSGSFPFQAAVREAIQVYKLEHLGIDCVRESSSITSTSTSTMEAPSLASTPTSKPKANSSASITTTTTTTTTITTLQKEDDAEEPADVKASTIKKVQHKSDSTPLSSASFSTSTHQKEQQQTEEEPFNSPFPVKSLVKSLDWIGAGGTTTTTTTTTAAARESIIPTAATSTAAEGTQPLLPLPPLLLSLDGNIGAGKSTLLKALRLACPELVVVKEPVDEWLQMCGEDGRSILELFYADPKRYAYTFQHTTLMTRISNTREALSTAPAGAVVVSERSILTDRYVFATMLRDQKQLSSLEWDLYSRWYKLLADATPVGGILYLTTDPTTCAARIQKRGRPGEVIDEAYLRDLHQAHCEWVKSGGVPALSLEFPDGENPEEAMVPMIREFIAKLRVNQQQQQQHQISSSGSVLTDLPVKNPVELTDFKSIKSSTPVSL